jgi:hypothetical protein
MINGGREREGERGKNGVRERRKEDWENQKSSKNYNTKAKE